MAKIRHIALTTKDPEKVAAFYKEAFDMEEVRRSDNGAVFLSDGYLNLAILNWQHSDKDADVGPNGDNYNGIHHIGFLVDDLDTASEKLEKVHGRPISTREGLTTMAPGSPRNFEMKWSGPDDVVIDISQTGWTTGK